MAVLPLPKTPGCLVCGPANPHGLRLKLSVDDQTGVVTVRYTPTADQMGFEGIVHGGALATVFDEAMVWAASWNCRRFCLCGEMSVRFRIPAETGLPLTFHAKIESSRPKLIQTSGRAQDESGRILATATGKYIPVPPERNGKLLQTFIEDPKTAVAAGVLRGVPD